MAAKKKPPTARVAEGKATAGKATDTSAIDARTEAGAEASTEIEPADAVAEPALPAADEPPAEPAPAPRAAPRPSSSDDGAAAPPPKARPTTARIPLFAATGGAAGAGGEGATRTTRALEHATAAAGARFIKRGFALTPETDLAFALGFPHLEYIVDDHPDDARSEMIAYERRGYRLGWPRNVAIRWCRVTACKGFKRTPQGASELDAAGKKAIKNGAALSDEEVALSLKTIFSETASYEDLRVLVRLFEAFVGPELVATSIVEALEKSSNQVWGHQDHDRALVVHHLGFALLRLPAGIADKLRSRLAAIFDRRVKALPSKELGPRRGERGSLLRALDVVLNGRAGAERSGERTEQEIDAADLVHIIGDDRFVREAACRVSSADARLVFLGGEPVLDHLLDGFGRLRGLHHTLIDGFAEVAAPGATELLQRIAKGREAPDRARAVLAARGS